MFPIGVYQRRSENPQLFQELLNEYEVIRSKLEVEITESGRSELFSDLIGLITRISDHIFRNEEKVRKGIGEIMGGHVLELESEKRARLMAEAKEQGREQGMAQGMAQGEERLSVLINRLILDDRGNEIQKVVTDKEMREAMYREYQL